MRTISKIINDYLYENKITKTFVANKIGESRANFSQKLSLTDLSVSFVMRISIALKYDFLAEYMAQYKKEMGIIELEKTDASSEKISEKLDLLMKEIAEMKGTKEKEIKQLKKSKSVR